MTWTATAKPTAGNSTLNPKPAMKHYLLARAGVYLVTKAGTNILVINRGDTWTPSPKPAL